MSGGIVVFGNVVLWLATIPAVLFVLLYARVRWEATQIGRQTMAMAFVIALTLCLIVFRGTFGDPPWYALLRLFVFATIVPILWWKFYLLLTAQREGVRSIRHPFTGEEDMEPDNDALEGNLGDLGDEEYFDHLARAKEEDFHGLDENGNRYDVDEGVQDLRGEKA